MSINPPEGIVVRIGNLKNFKIGRNLNLKDQDIHVVLTSQPGMLQGRNEFELVGAPAELQEGGGPLGSRGIEASSSAHLGGEGKTYPLDHLVIVLDTSASMNYPSKIGHIKERLKALEPHISKETVTSLVLFDESARTALKCEGDFNKVVKYVDQLEAKGYSTNICDGISKANTEFSKKPGYDLKNPGRSLCLFITDGIDSGGEKRVNDIYKETESLTQLRNCPIVVVGVGTDYRTDVIKNMAGSGLSGAWAHTSSTNPEVDVFGKFIPGLIKELKGNDTFIRIDTRGPDRIWSTSPSVQELSFLARKVTYPDGNKYNSVFGGYWSEPALVALSPKTVREWLEFKIAGQDDTRIHTGKPFQFTTPSELGKPMDIVNLDELLPADKDRASKEFLKWLLAVTMQERDLNALKALHKAGIVPKELLDKAENAFQGDFDEEASRSIVSSVSIGGLSHRSIGPLESQIFQSQFGPDISRIDKVDKSNARGQNQSIDISRLLSELEKAALEGEQDLSGNVELYSASQEQGYNPMFSGALGPLDAEPQESNLGSIGPLGPNAAKVYDFNPEIETVYKAPNLDLIINTPLSLKEGDKLIIGRNPSADIVVTGTGSIVLSRKHCEISVKNGKVIIRDLGSTNGTYVNNERINGEKELQKDDVVMVGGWMFKVKI